MARLVAFDALERHHIFRVVLEAPPWKTDRTAASMGTTGDTVEYRTPISTATCGVPPEPGAVYVFFGRRSQVDSKLDIDTCSGTRVHRSADGRGESVGFRDVPGRFVVSRLNALGGLRELAALPPLPEPTDTAHAVLRGLLDLAPLAHGGVVRVFERPAPAAPVLTTIDEYAAVVSREVGYEVAAAAVFGRIDGWSRVRLADGRVGWIADGEAGTWFPYEDLAVRRLAYLTPASSGWIWPGPGAGIPTRVERAEGHAAEQPVEVLEARVVGGVPWFRVSVLADSPCEAAGGARPVAGGWVPGYGLAIGASELQPTVWYWSRGC